MCEFFLKVMVQLRKILVLIIGIATYVLSVSYTHLTLPTN